MADTKISREALYDLVWQRPLSQLAKEFGISDVGLRKICHQHDIPTASNQWWSAKEYRKPAVQTRLPDSSQFAGKLITIPRSGPRYVPSPERIEATTKAADVMAKAQKVVSHRGLPQIAKDMIAELKACKPDEHGGIYLDSPSCFKFSINEAELPRVTALISQLVPAVLELGYEIKPTDKGARIVAEGYEIPVHVRAFLKQMQIKSKWSLSGIGRAYLPSNKLAVILNDLGGREGRYGFGDRKEFVDTARHLVEERTEKIIAAIALEPSRRREAAERRRRWEEEWAEEERKREHARWLKRREVERHELLDELIAANRKGAGIRSLLDTLPHKAPKNDAQYAAFIQWTKRRLQSLNDRLSADSVTAKLKSDRLFDPDD